MTSTLAPASVSANTVFFPFPTPIPPITTAVGNPASPALGPTFYATIGDTLAGAFKTFAQENVDAVETDENRQIAPCRINNHCRKYSDKDDTVLSLQAHGEVAELVR